MNHRPIDEIQKELQEAIAHYNQEITKKQKETKPIYQFSLIPAMYTHKEVYDPTCRLYDLIGIVLNREELVAAYKSPFEGSMTYLFNSLSGKFVMGVSGGQIFVSDANCWAELSEFIKENYAGGDVTHIVTKYFPKNWG